MKKQPAYLWPASTQCYSAADVDARIAELEKALRLIIQRVELFDDDDGLSKYDPSVTDAKALLRTTS